MSYSVQDYVSDLKRIARPGVAEAEIFATLGACAKRLVENPGWLEPRFYEADPEQGFGVHLLHEEPDHSLACLVVSWLPGRGIGPHNHGTWAIVAGIEGEERNVRYARVDDGARPDRAELEVKAEFPAGPGDVLCIKDGGIHAVWNDSDKISLSLHTYGRHINHTGRSGFDLETKAVQPFQVAVS